MIGQSDSLGSQLDVPQARVSAHGHFAQRAASSVSTGLWWAAGRRARHPLGILLYHRIADCTENAATPTWNVTPARFRRQLVSLLQRGYRFWPLQRVLESVAANAPLPSKTVVVTFDDGYANNYLRAFPILESLEIPATVFVNTAYLDSNEPFPFDAWAQQHSQRVATEDWRPLRRDECHAMLRSGLIELGGHTHTHQDFRSRTAAFADDLQTNLKILSREFALAHVPFAFPFGRARMGFTSPEMMNIANRAGVTCALTTECEPVNPASSPFGWGRFNVYEWDNAATLAAKLAGWYGWAPRLQEQWIVYKARFTGKSLPHWQSRAALHQRTSRIPESTTASS